MAADGNGAGGGRRGADALPGLVRGMLEALGEDPDRDGLRDTPARVAEAWGVFTRGYDQRVEDEFAGAVFEDAGAGLIVVRDVEFYSLCEHHLVPFFGVCHVGYLPDRRIVGLSKIARVVEVFARRLQVQERLTRQVADAIETHLRPRGTAVIVEARHLCMSMRGVEKHRPVVTTRDVRGAFAGDAALRAEFLAHVSGRPGR